MPKILLLSPHLTLAELEERYRTAKTSVEKSHWQVIWLRGQGKSIREIAEVTSFCPNWIRTLLHRYNENGLSSMQDQRHKNAGTAPILSTELQLALITALDEPPQDGGLWTGKKVALWILEQTDRRVHPQRGWEYLKRLGYSKQVLRPRHAKASQEEQEACDTPVA